MKLPLKLSRSRSNSSSSSTSSSPRATPSTSPTSSQKKHRFPLPRIGGSRRSRQDTTSLEIVEASTSARTPTSPFSIHGKGKQERSAAASPSAASTSSPWIHPEGKMQEIQQVFAQFDANGDGKISSEELQAVLASLGDETTREEAALMVHEVDVDGDGFIDLQEFVEMNRRLQVSTEEEEMEAAFAIFDLEKKGRITAEGLQKVLQRMGGSLAQGSTVEDCKRMIRGVDRKGVGHVDFDDFKRMMTPLTF